MPKKKLPIKSKKSPMLVQLGQKLADVRRARGISQEQFAHEMGLHRTYAGMLERGERNATITNILRACAALGIRPGELLDDLPEVGPKDEA